MTTIRKAKSAFLFYQGDQLATIRAELNLSMGDAMTEVGGSLRFVSYCFVDSKHTRKHPNTHTQNHTNVSPIYYVSY